MRKKSSAIAVFLFLFLFFYVVKGQNTCSVIPIGDDIYNQITYTLCNEPSIAVSSTGHVYVACIDLSSKAVIKKFDGNSWQTISSSITQSVAVPSIYLDANDVPYFAFADGSNSNKATVLKYNGTVWVSVGNPGFTSSYIYKPSLTFDKNNIPYIAYSENGIGACVRKFVGNNWVLVGPAGFKTSATDNKILLDTADVPYVCLSGGFMNVLKFDGNNWNDVGPPNLAGTTCYNSAFAMNKSGTLYAAYTDDDNGSIAWTRKFDGNNWNIIGGQASVGAADYLSLKLDTAGIPYVAYGPSIRVRRFNGTNWQAVGDSAFGNTVYTNLTFNANNEPYIVYRSNIFNNKIVAKKFNGNNWSMVGGNGLSEKTCYPAKQLQFDASNNPYIISADIFSGYYKSYVKKYLANSWTTVGDTSFTATDGSIIHRLTFDLNGAPHITAMNASGLVVLKYINNTWVQVGVNNVHTYSGYGITVVDLKFDPFNVPYVSFSIGYPQSYTSIKKLVNNNWVDVGSTIATSQNNSFVELIINSSGAPFLCQENALPYPNHGIEIRKFDGVNWINILNIPNGSNPSMVFKNDTLNFMYVSYGPGKANVIKYTGTNWINVGPADFSPPAVSYCSLDKSANGDLYASYVNQNQIFIDIFGNGNWHNVITQNFPEPVNRLIVNLDNYENPHFVIRGTGVYVYKLGGICTDIKTYEKNTNWFSIFPNPSSIDLQLIRAKTDFPPLSVTVEIYDILGQKVITITDAPVEQKINVESLNRGIYILKIKSGSLTESVKLIKE